jgi:hypothetical protein
MDRESGRNYGKNQEQQQGNDEVFESRRKIAAMPDGKHADVVGRRRCQQDFRDQIGLDQFPAEKNHGRSDHQPRRRGPLDRVNHLVIEGKVIDQQDRNSGPRVQNKWRPAGPAVNPDLINAQSEEIQAEQAVSVLSGFSVCRHGSGWEIIVRRRLSVHDWFPTGRFRMARYRANLWARIVILILQGEGDASEA